MNTETLNGHAVPSGITEEVRVDIESPDALTEEKTPADTNDTEGKLLTCLCFANKLHLYQAV